MTEAQRLYDVLDRLVDSLINEEGDHPDHRYSPLGSALHVLHTMKYLATDRCVCAEQYADTPA